MAYELKLFSGNANRALAEEIAQYLRVPLGDAEVSRFSDGEIFVQINENVRGADVFVIQPTCPPVNDTLMELLDHDRRAQARVGPPDHRGAALLRLRAARTARWRAACRSRPSWWPTCSRRPGSTGCSRSTCTPARSRASSTSRSTTCSPRPVVMIDYLEKKDLHDPVLVSPDAGGVERARAIAKRLNAAWPSSTSAATAPTSAVAMHLIGDVEDGTW